MEKLPPLFAQINNPENEGQQQKAVKEALALAQKIPLPAFAPIAQNIAKNRLENLSHQEILAAYRIMNAADLKIPGYWIDLVDELSLEDHTNQKNNFTYLKLLIASHLANLPTKISDDKYDKIHSKLKHLDIRSQEILYNIMKSVDNYVINGNNPVKAYEKDFFLTFAVDYVMPSTVVWDRLIEARPKEAVGETILLSTALLQEQNLQDTYPGLFRDILQNFETVGLTELSRDLALTACLESKHKM